MIKNIVFDIGNVLIDFCWAKHMENLGFSEDAIFTLGKNMINNPIWNELDRNNTPASEIIDRFRFENSNYENEINLFFDNPDGLIMVYPESKSWLKSLRERGYNVYLLSNYPEREFNVHINKFDFVEYINGRVVSYEVKEIKPNKGIYEALMQKYNLLYEECVFLDDKRENIEAADILGMYTILVKNQKQAMEDLEILLKTNS